MFKISLRCNYLEVNLILYAVIALHFEWDYKLALCGVKTLLGKVPYITEADF